MKINKYFDEVRKSIFKTNICGLMTDLGLTAKPGYSSAAMFHFAANIIGIQTGTPFKKSGGKACFSQTLPPPYISSLQESVSFSRSVLQARGLSSCPPLSEQDRAPRLPRQGRQASQAEQCNHTTRQLPRP